MNIIAICGSPRKGNTEFILKRILTKAEDLGAKGELVLLREKRIEFCNGCLNCDSSGKCGIRDEMQLIYGRMEESDLIIFGSPTYFDSMSGLMKVFVDRLNPYYSSKKLSGKKMTVVATGQSDFSSIKKNIDGFQTLANNLKLSMVGDMYFVAKDPQDIEKDPKNIKKIDEFTKNLVCG